MYTCCDKFYKYGFSIDILQNLLIALVLLNNLLTVSSLLFLNCVQRISYETVLNIGIRACNYGIVRCEATSLNVLQPRHCRHSRNKLSID